MRPSEQPHESPAVPSATASPSDSPVEQAALPSLPPAEQGADLAISRAPTRIRAPKRATVKKKALVIVAMRAQGYTSDEISKAVGLRPATCRQYLYLAKQYGVLQPMADPQDELEFNVGAMAVKNLKDMLESDQILEKGQRSVKMETTLKVAEGLLFKKGGDGAAPVQQNVLHIEIQGTQNPAVNVSDGGKPFYEGEVINVEKK